MGEVPGAVLTAIPSLFSALQQRPQPLLQNLGWSTAGQPEIRGQRWCLQTGGKGAVIAPGPHRWVNAPHGQLHPIAQIQ